MKKDVEVIKRVGEEGLRIFSIEDVARISNQIGIKPAHLSGLIHRLRQSGLIRRLFRGTYVLPNSILSGPPLHEYEVLLRIANPSALCCLSALSFHGLTDQILRRLLMMTPYGKTRKNTSKYEYVIEGKPYTVIRVKPELFFGVEKRFINDVVFFVTDLERTLIDGLIRPQYCGGFLEVMHAFKGAQDKINIDKMMGYALLCGKASCKRLGWVFEELGIFKNEQKILKEIPCTSSYVIDVSRPSSGEWIRDWRLKKNWS